MTANAPAYRATATSDGVIALAAIDKGEPFRALESLYARPDGLSACKRYINYVVTVESPNDNVTIELTADGVNRVFVGDELVYEL